MKKTVIGIVGGIGSGKSLVAAAFAVRGGHLIEADQLGHEALRQPDIKKQVIGLWGPGVVNDQGEINRRALGKIVFADERQRQKLESLVFPWIGRRIAEEIERGRQDDYKSFIVLDAAIMFETGWYRSCDKIVFVDAPREIRLQRLNQTRGWTDKDSAVREQAQMPLAEKRQRADVVLMNDGTTADLDAQVDKILATIILQVP